MATHTLPNLPASDPPGLGPPLTRDETFDLIFSLYGSATEMFAEVGGSDAWIRFLRDEDDEPETSEA